MASGPKEPVKKTTGASEEARQQRQARLLREAEDQRMNAVEEARRREEKERVIAAGALTSEQIRHAQALLVELGADVTVDGLLGPRTVRAARDYAMRAEQLYGPKRAQPIAAVARQALRPLEERGSPEAETTIVPATVRPLQAWIFYAPIRKGAPDWLREVRAGNTIFWRHGLATSGGAYRKQLQTYDTVFLLVGNSLYASGVLLTDDDLRFVDSRGRICRPVRIVETYEPALDRRDIEGASGSLIRQGAVHPVPSVALDAILRSRDHAKILSERETKRRRELPFSVGAFDRPVYRLGLVENLQAGVPEILPDAATAAAIGWHGEIWQKPEGADYPLHIEVQSAAHTEDAEPAHPPPRPDVDAQIPFVLDAPADSEDQLDRGPFALFLAQRLHLIWCQMNGHAPDGRGGRTPASPADSDTFIVHVDSPWGGGKTTFANFVARVLNPRGQVLSPGHFLRSSLAPTDSDTALAKVALNEVFVPPFARDDPAKWSGARRPWVVARYNAWRDQYVQPPWWQVFLAIQSEVTRELRRDAGAALRDGWLNGAPGDYVRADERITRWGSAVFQRFAYQVWNRKLKAQLVLLGLVAGFVGAIGYLGAFDWLIAGGKGDALEPKRASEWIALATAVLGLGGASVAALLTAVSQSLAPDLDFTAEHRQIGVQDPISRFRRTFDRILRATDRPVLLIVDDLDRCDPRTVVELLRGFQTIIRSPRLFVLLLGDRAWIENAHDVVHKEVAGLHEGEGGLGARFVQKVIQLSFRLPTIKADARTRFARGVLGDAPGDAKTHQVAEVLRKVDEQVSGIVGEGQSLGDREAKVALVLEEARSALPEGLSDAETEAAVNLVETLANVKIVSAAGADTAQQRSVFNAVTRLVGSLPNNPRQIKRIFMAFATYEVVGRIYFGYQLTAEGPDGERKARRWRQLAMWVTLAIEWPGTWRAIAMRPSILDAAYVEPKARAKADAALLKALPEEEQKAVRAILERLRGDRALSALLSRSGTAPAGGQDDFAWTAMDSEAVYEFNRIIWEPGFEIEPPGAA